MERPTKQIEPSFILPIIEQKSKRTGSLILFFNQNGRILQIIQQVQNW